jgi:hypothetical protein
MAFYSSTSTIRGAGGVTWDSDNQIFTIGTADYPDARFVHFSGTNSGIITPVRFVQTHDSADASNIQFLRNRGTASSVKSIQAGDDIADIVFSARYEYDTPDTIQGVVGMSVIAVSTSSFQRPTGKILYTISNGSTLAPVAELTSSTWRVIGISSLSGPDLIVRSNLVPSANLTYDLGSTSSQWRSLYVGTSTIYLGGTALSVADGAVTVNGTPVLSSDESYTPTTSGDWDGTAPTTLSEAIDRLAALVKLLNSGTGA